MTEPPDSLPPDGRDEPIEPVDDAAVARLRAMLRDEPVQDDELARERRLRAALDAAGPVATTAPVPRPRRAGPRPWLVAAAVLAVVGVAGFFVLSLDSSGGQDEMGSAGDSAELERAPADDGATSAESAQDQAPVSSTTAPPAVAGSADSSTAAVVDLGSFADEAALRAALTDRDGWTDEQLRGLDPTTSPGADQLRCVSQQQVLGLEVVGVAELGLRELVPVVVVRVGDGVVVLDALSCTPLQP